jgi:hypothetical protein
MLLAQNSFHNQQEDEDREADQRQKIMQDIRKRDRKMMEQKIRDEYDDRLRIDDENRQKEEEERFNLLEI